MGDTLGVVTSVVAAATVVTLFAGPASGTVQEIVGQWCDGVAGWSRPGSAAAALCSSPRAPTTRR